MKTFEITLEKVLWIKAPSEEAMWKAIAKGLIKECEEDEDLYIQEETTRYLEGRDEQISPEQCDYVVEEE